MGALRVECVRDLEALDTHADAWDALALMAPPRRPTLAHGWVRAFLTHRLTPRLGGVSWSCTFAWDGDELVGVLPLRRKGSQLHNLCDDHTPSGDALVMPGADAPTVLEALLHGHGPFRAARFDGIVPSSPTHAWLSSKPGGRAVLHKPAVMTGAQMDATASYESLHARLSKNARSKLRKGERLLEGEGALAFRIATTRQELLRAYFSFMDVEEKGWKGQQGTALAGDGSARNFYKELIDRLGPQGWLRFHLLELDDEAVAVEMVIRFADSLVVHKVAYDEAHARTSPGNLIWARTLAHACADREIERVDLLAMDELMQRWGATAYPYDSFTLFARGLWPTLLKRWPAQWRAQLGRFLRKRAP